MNGIFGQAPNQQLIPYDHFEDQQIEKQERILMREFNLTYSELQNMPIATLRLWVDELSRENQKRLFQEMVAKNERNSPW
jgi:hypothetical protein